MNSKTTLNMLNNVLKLWKTNETCAPTPNNGDAQLDERKLVGARQRSKDFQSSHSVAFVVVLNCREKYKLFVCVQEKNKLLPKKTKKYELLDKKKCFDANNSQLVTT